MLRQARTITGAIIWIDETTKVGDYVTSPNGDNHCIAELQPIWLGDGKVNSNPKVKVTIEEVRVMDLEVSDVMIMSGEELLITAINKEQGVTYAYVDTKKDGVKQPSLRLHKKAKQVIKLRSIMNHLNLQNAVESARTLTSLLEQLLDITNLEPIDGKLPIGNSNIRVDKVAVVRGAKDAVCAEKGKLVELIKKL